MHPTKFMILKAPPCLAAKRVGVCGRGSPPFLTSEDLGTCVSNLFVLPTHLSTAKYVGVISANNNGLPFANIGYVINHVYKLQKVGCSL